MLYDTHCHPYLAQEKSQEKILHDFFRNEDYYLNAIACDIKSSETSIAIAQKHPHAYASIGIHPNHTIRSKHSLTENISTLMALYQKFPEYIVAIGECGLDYYWLNSLSKQYGQSTNEIRLLQKKYFISQISLAKELGLPFIIHSRESHEDVLEILIQENYKNFVFHCFSAPYDFAKKLLEFAPDAKLGFGGIVSFKNAHDVHESVTKIPLKNIIIETDSPYLSPSPFRGKEENEPLYCQYVLSHIIELRTEDPRMIQEQIFDNSKKVFAI